MKRGMIEENEHEQPAATFRTSDQAVAAGNSGEQGARAIVGSEEQHFLKDYGESFIKLLISGKKNLGKKQKEFLEKRLSQSLQNYLEFISDDSRHNHLKRLTSHLCDIYALALMELPTTFRTSDQAVAAGNSGEQGASAILGSEEQHFLKDYGESFIKLLISDEKNLGKGKEVVEKLLYQTVQNYFKFNDQSRDDHAQALKSFTDHIIDNYRVNLVSVGEDSVVEGEPRTPVQPEGGPHSSGVYGALFVKLLISAKNLGKEKEEAVEKFLSQTVQNYLKFNDQSRDAQALKSLTDFIINSYSVPLITVAVGSVVIIVECHSLESLEHLWADYLDGSLDKVAERYLVTNEMRKELNLETVCLTTTIEEESYLNCKKALMALPETCSGSSIPAEIRRRGARAERAFQKAMQTGRKVKVYRGRIMLLGQDRAGKTSLRKSLLGLPFDPERESTVGVEVDEVEKWMPVERKKGEDNIARFIFRGLRGSETLDNDSMAADPNVEEGKTTDQLEEKKDHKEPKLSPDGDEPVTSTEEIEVGLKALSEENRVDKNELSNELQLNSNLNFTELAARYSQSRPEDDIKSEEVILSLWDFAGQHLYYASHSVFLSGRAVYILVYNLNKNLLATAEPCVKQGVNDIRLDNPSNETNLDNLLSWLVSIHNIRSAANKNVAHQRRKLPYQRPPVIIVGTNLDQPFEEVATTEMRIRASIMGKEYTKHVITTFFAVDNSKENDEGVQKLRDKIMEVLKHEPYMPEEVPLRWFNFERAVDALVAKQKYFMDLDQLRSVIRLDCHIEGEEEVTTMLNFYLDLGVIVKHGRTVVLQAQWLIDLFKQLITVSPFNEANPLYVNCWRELEVNGILREALVDDVFSKFIDKGLCKQDILGMMEQHGLVAKFLMATDENQDEQRYFVPTQLRSSPSALCEIKPSECDPCPLILHFLDGFVPHGLFPQLVSKFIHWCSENGFKKTPQLFNNGARLFVGKQITFALILICRRRFIKIVLKTRNPSSSRSLSMNASNKMAIEVRNFIERTLDDFSRDFSWLSNLRYELSVVCTHCQQRESDLDGLMSCCHDDRLHLLRVRPGEELICMENFSDETVKVPRWEMWFEVSQSQTIDSEGDTQAADGASSELKTTGQGVETKKRKRKKNFTGLDESISQDDALLIAHELGSLWEMVGRALNVPDAVIDQIEANKSDVTEKCYYITLLI